MLELHLGVVVRLGQGDGLLEIGFDLGETAAGPSAPMACATSRRARDMGCRSSYSSNTAAAMSRESAKAVAVPDLGKRRGRSGDPRPLPAARYRPMASWYAVAVSLMSAALAVA